ncbi:ABC transporter, CydDC cysteine exporter (CydDC-E) family, permease/ATP-binding protein CydC [Desulfurispirillum indicum S5]|uniref:ABC transporter, CydDC cysteine exporter (CydDC-E) family, permease/ATP-binding protein CydC n=1 Tax=Desulfurispirillum indicum (strain ATCC BAA-1389 / DSM 22839 / S5) TaxID=653733 RepID=E6W5U6_DESIS|nr:cysteine/glutathione ABC transporter ATP-binding protein/permease CydC [Desulfurispirillum indicum]ADU67231.1 ABC transporter, CydDC cysteine exporter (CydDC-E) family, permease/ATP-binding protein CydC [Desulfurispirillum indicum S5]
MRELLPFVRLFWPSRLWIFWGAFFGLATMVASVGLLALSGWFLSAAAFAGLSVISAREFNFFTPSAGVRGFAILRTGGRYAERILSHEATFRLLASLRVWFYQRIEPLAPAGLLRHRSGDLLSRIVTDIDTLDGLFLRVISPLLIALGLAAIAGTFLWWLSPVLALIFWFFFALAGLLVPLLVRHMGNQIGRTMQQCGARLRTAAVEDMQGMADLMVYGADTRHRARLLEESERLLMQQERMARVSGLSSALMTLLAGLAAVSALFAAIPLAQQSVFDGAMLALITFGILATFEAVLPIPHAFQFLGKTREAARRLLEVTEVEPAVTFPENPCREAAGALCLKSVSFAYAGGSGAEALRDVSLSVADGAKVAIVGPSGSGKSTLAHLLVRFWDPRSGQITLGDSDLRQLSEEQLRNTITLVSQKSHIFCATMRENLLIAAPHADEQQLWQALEQAQLADFVRGLPEGLDTWAGEGGARLSGGQARRLVLARALLKNVSIWVLDEPTEGLDAVTQQQFMATLLDSLAGQTLILITHITAGLEAMDTVYFMEDGQLICSGSHRQLLRTSERYRVFTNCAGD